MFSDLWHMMARSFSVSNPSGSELDQMWSTALTGATAGSFVWLVSLFVLAAMAFALARIASKKVKTSFSKNLQLAAWILVTMNLFFIWFGPSFKADYRIATALLNDPPTVAKTARITKTWDTSGVGTKTRRIRYFLEATSDEPEKQPLEFKTSYDTFEAAKSDPQLRMRCNSQGACFIDNDFVEFGDFCMTAAVAAVGNLLLAAGFGYLVWMWRKE